jgi:poly-gamma-glutamate synthesis protein (capsule biosynthesis protein)
MKKKLLIFFGAFLLTMSVVLAWKVFTSHNRIVEAPQPSNNAPVEQTSEPTKIRLTAVGDMLAHDSINLAAKTEAGYDYSPLFTEVQSYLSSGDVTYCNQEGPSAGEELGISGYPTFNAPKEFSRDIQKAGCNIVNLANNHIGDKGQTGIDLTLSNWETLKPLAFTGANRSPQEQAQPKYFEVNGIKFAFIAFTDLSNNKTLDPFSVNMFSNDLIEQLAQEASKNADFVIASAHWGIEDSSKVSPSQKGWAQAMADSGVDLILGEGPHVLQPVEVIKTESGREVPVWYSLGNFLSTQLTAEQLVGGIAVMDFDIEGQKLKLSNMSFLPTYMHYEWTPEQAAAEDLLARTNLKLLPLANSAEFLAKSQLGTTVEAQSARVTEVLNSITKVQIIQPSEF